MDDRGPKFASPEDRYEAYFIAIDNELVSAGTRRDFDDILEELERGNGQVLGQLSKAAGNTRAYLREKIREREREEEK